MYKGEDVTVFKFQHFVLFRLFEFKSRDGDTSGGYLQETFWPKGITKQKKTLNCWLPDAEKLSFPTYPVSTTVRNKHWGGWTLLCSSMALLYLKWSLGYVSFGTNSMTKLLLTSCLRDREILVPLLQLRPEASVVLCFTSYGFFWLCLGKMYLKGIFVELLRNQGQKNLCSQTMKAFTALESCWANCYTLLRLQIHQAVDRM